MFKKFKEIKEHIKKTTLVPGSNPHIANRKANKVPGFARGKQYKNSPQNTGQYKLASVPKEVSSGQSGIWDSPKKDHSKYSKIHQSAYVHEDGVAGGGGAAGSAAGGMVAGVNQTPGSQYNDPNIPYATQKKKKKMLRRKRPIMETLMNFKSFLAEAKAASAKNPADSRGKIHELLTAYHLNNKNHAEDYRVEGKKPEHILHQHASALFGKNYHKHPEFLKMHEAAKQAAQHIREHLKKHHGISEIGRVAWTSQKSDHKKETGVDDPLNKADLIVTGKHKGDHRKGKKVAVSLKFGKLKKTNYSNPGVKTLENLSSTKLTHHTEEHKKLLNKLGNPSHEEYKTHPKRKEIEASSKKMAQNMAYSYADGLSEKLHHKTQNKQDENLKEYIRRSVGGHGHTPGGNVEQGKTHLPHVFAKTSTGSGEGHSTQTGDIEHHVNNYLSHFHNLNVQHTPGQSSVAVIGNHRKTGKRMEVHRVSIYMGGAHETANPRGAVTLSSENHKDVDTSKPYGVKSKK